MALNWKTAQVNEKKFWEDIYIKNKNDEVYEKTKSDGWKSFAEEILKRNKIELVDLHNKKIVDLGCGPAGMARGLDLLIKKKKINNSNIIAIDPLMDFFKKEIKILKENKNLKLLSNQGESINLQDNSVDIIFCTNVLDHCENPNLVIDECFRILKPGGILLPSTHVIYNYLDFVSSYIKYFDQNHPHHLTEVKMKKILFSKFTSTKTVNRFSMAIDQRKFTFLNIFKSKDVFRAFKRYISNFVLYTCYFKCVKKK